MANPWTRRNPLLSVWLSGANAVADKARGAATAEAKRQQASLAKEATRFWSGAWPADAKPEAKGARPKRRR